MRSNVCWLVLVWLLGGSVAALADGIVVEFPGTDGAATTPERTTLRAGTQSVDVTLTLPPDDGDAGEQLQTDGAGNLTWEPAGGVGSSVTLDLGDDGANESSAITEFATVRDDTSIFTESAADKLLIDVAKLKPVAFEQVFFMGEDGGNCGIATAYIGPGTDCNATETSVDFVVHGAITLTGLSCTQIEDTTCSTLIATVRDDAADTAITCTTTNADTCTITGSVAVAEDSLVALKLVDSSGCTDGVRVQCVLTYTY